MMNARSGSQKGFSRPKTMRPVEQVYRMFNEFGLPRGHEPHFHADTFEICYVQRGTLNWWIGEAIYEVHGGDVVVMPRRVPHGSMDSTLQPCEYYAVHLDPQELPREIAEAMTEPSFEGLHRSKGEAGALVLQIFQEHENRDALSEEACRSLCNLLVLTLARDRWGSSSSGKVSRFVVEAMNNLISDASLEAPVASAAKRMNVSEVWLNKRFREETGQAPGEWLRARKISRAKKLLALQHFPVADVAERLGFKSSQNFATAFKRETGLTPSAYRDRYVFTMHLRRSMDSVSPASAPVSKE